jgi:3-phenylpropionate/trans-cinnamate dioxygenase ferredoxin component
MAEWVDAGEAGEPREGSIRAVTVGGEYLAIAYAGGEWRAFQDDCTHEECPLSDGEVEGTTVVCPCHGSEFDVATGEVLLGPATEPIRLFPVRAEGGRLQVEVDG